MKTGLFSVVISIFLVCSSVYGTECQVTLPGNDNLDPPFDPTLEGFAWFGSNDLAARAPKDGHWTAMGPDYNYRDKWWWWREGYNAHDERKPALEITATMLDGEALPVHIPHATNAMSAHNPPRWHRILTLMEFPAPGCWEVTATYYENELKFVFQVGG